MIWAAIACFVIAAGFGVALALARQKGQPLATPVALVHGGFAATGVVLLLVLTLQGVMPSLGIIALAIFGGAALGGVGIFSTRFREGAKAPMGLIAVHALAAATALVLLLVTVL